MTKIPPNAVVVVVDDDVFELLGASGMFSDAGYRVLEAGNADEALRFFEANADIGLLFTDVSMPGSMSGSDLARQVAERWPGVGIIMTSGRPRPLKLPLSMLFHDKPYEPAAVLRQAREMTAWQHGSEPQQDAKALHEGDRIPSPAGAAQRAELSRLP